ncbi:MAG TPA: PQQ-binding-like beta-propeller repeat protein [Pyrinomonadaceae bacterium]|nr:PQQ-binding-like beta-propeller repeat protein [Pyrinomonadaceae bacterium]
MSSPDPTVSSSALIYRFVIVLLLAGAVFVSISCMKVTKGEPDHTVATVAPKPPPAPLKTWLGNPERNYYGSGPWKEGQLKITWEVKTSLISGQFHKDGWGGTSWPGQPSVIGERVYFPSADGNTYALNRSDGATIWAHKGKDSFKATPTLTEEKVIANGLDHHVYCLNAKDGSVIWDYETGFEVDGAAAVVGDRVYFGAEDKNFYCLTLAEGKLVYKIPVGSVEGSVTFKDDRIYFGTEQGELYCLNASDGSIVWRAKIGSDSDSTPAVINGMVYTAAEDGVVRAYDQATGTLIWHYVTEGNRLYLGNEKKGIWASPIVYKNKVYIGGGNGYLHCLSADKGELVWRYQAHGPIWGTAPVVDERVVFGDKAGWINMISAEDGKLISDIRIGENVNSTPAIMDGQIYIGAFMGKLFRLDLEPVKPKPTEPPKTAVGQGRKRKPARKRKLPAAEKQPATQPVANN